MKEYILVNLSSILKAVEKTKWPEEPERCAYFKEQKKFCALDFNEMCYCETVEAKEIDNLMNVIKEANITYQQK